MILVDDDSPLRRLPVDLDAKQSLMLDGFRVTAETAGIAYGRLEATALRASEAAEGDMWGPLISLLFADAWAFIDAVERLRGFIGLISANPSESKFLDATGVVRDVRDALQHAGKRLDSLVAAQQSMVGTLTWVYTPDPAGPDRQLAVTMGGRLPAGEYKPGSWEVAPMIASASRTIDHIVLSTHQPPKRAARTAGGAPYHSPARAGQVSVSLTQVLGEVVTLVKKVEAQIAPQFEGHEVAPMDGMLMLHFELGAPDADSVESAPADSGDPGTPA